jgi:hypothetical protein
MRTLLFFVLMPVLGLSQTVDIENAYINKAISEKKWDQMEAAKRGKLWQQLRAEYPVLPFDTVSKEIHVESIITFPGITKDVAYRRIKEWAALNFGKLSSVLEYENEASGKIIIEGLTEIKYNSTFKTIWGNNKAIPTDMDMYFSLMLTVKDGKAKVQYENLRYRTFVPGYGSGVYYVPSEYFNLRFGFMFPITASDTSSWEGYLDLLKKSMAELNATAPSLELYIRGADSDYRF